MIKISSVNRNCALAKPPAAFFAVLVPKQWWKINETGICLNVVFGRSICIRSALDITEAGGFEALEECSMINVIESKL